MFPTFAKQSRKRCYRERKADKVTEGESERDREREREKKREREKERERERARAKEILKQESHELAAHQ